MFGALGIPEKGERKRDEMPLKYTLQNVWRCAIKIRRRRVWRGAYCR